MEGDISGDIGLGTNLPNGDSTGETILPDGFSSMKTYLTSVSGLDTYLMVLSGRKTYLIVSGRELVIPMASPVPDGVSGLEVVLPRILIPSQASE